MHSIVKKPVIIMASLFFIAGLSMPPVIPDAHASMGHIAKRVAMKVTKKWLLHISANEGRRASLASLKALSRLPADPVFRATVLAALSGGGAVEAKTFALNVAKTAASDQVGKDLTAAANNKHAISDSFSGFVGHYSQETWNDIDDRLTCGQNNVEVTAKGDGQYTIEDDSHSSLLRGRALLQRGLFKALMRNGSYATQEEAQAAANRYSKRACTFGKSNKLMAFLGGFSLAKDTVKAKLSDPVSFFNSLQRWSVTAVK